MKGIILAGGIGSRLYPLNQVMSKQLMPVYDKPMIYYPLSTLMLGGIKKILIISFPDQLSKFQNILNDGSQWGISISYKPQEEANGIAEAFIIGKEFIGREDVCLILGDNIFYGKIKLDEIISNFNSGATIFGYYVKDPERYGVVDFDKQNNVLSIEEKPKKPKTNFAVPGLYIYDNEVIKISEELKPSDRGELEITDVNLKYLEMKKLKINLLGRGIAWLDTGTHKSLIEASNFIRTIEERQGLKIACLEEIAYVRNFINKEKFNQIITKMPNSTYRDYLFKLQF